MNYDRDFFEMRVTNGTWYGYRIAFQDADVHGEQKLMTVQRNIQGRLCTVQPPAIHPRTMVGLIRVSPTREGNGESSPNNTASYGSLADLRTCYYADQLEVRAWNDDANWSAKWVGLWAPKNMDLKGVWFMVPCQLEQIE
jgi:hypothetical protein